MITRFELPNRTAFNADMPAAVSKEDRVLVGGEQYGASEIIWKIREEGDGPLGFDQYVVLVKYHVRADRGDYNSPLVPEPDRVLL